MSWLQQLRDRIWPARHAHVSIRDIREQSSVKVEVGATYIHRPAFELTATWLKAQLALSFDDEIKSKYIPELHQDHDFERKELMDILDFVAWRKSMLQYVNSTRDALKNFQQQQHISYRALTAEGIVIKNQQHPLMMQVNALDAAHNDILSQLAIFASVLKLPGYDMLAQQGRIKPINYPAGSLIQVSGHIWEEILNKLPRSPSAVNALTVAYNRACSELNYLNNQLDRIIAGAHYKVIIGNAGSGKTHTSAHLVAKVQENKDYALFFKAKQFNGDDVELESRLLKLLSVPEGYRLDEVLTSINEFVSAQKKRCFIIIDALNETTKSSIGFSNIWHNGLQTLINKIKRYSHLYLVCTLRTSYIDNIWSVRPAILAELKGFTKQEDIQEACKKYFAHYKIIPANLENADLHLFEKPLLLDLFCKLANGERRAPQTIELNIGAYLNIFDNYIVRLVEEVKNKLNLQMVQPIRVGLLESSRRFLANNEAVLELDEFSTAFDTDERVTRDHSIARAVLEGYLLFSKDNAGTNEVIKHTQQEVGGYLLARLLADKYPDTDTLINSPEMREKITGANTGKHHQLRLDILKFLIAIRPDLITQLPDRDSIGLAWWYLYNGFNEKDTALPRYLASFSSAKILLDEALPSSMSKWDDPACTLNFNFIAELLGKLNAWEFDCTWTFFVYLREEIFRTTLLGHLQSLEEGKYIAPEKEKLIARISAFVTATTSRPLRHIATIYLVKFGKRYPRELLELTVYSASLPDSYIYERLTACCYGVAMMLQNDPTFVNQHLAVFALQLIDLQFAPHASHPVYNYIVMDAIKHLADLALYKKVITLPESLLDQLHRYHTPQLPTWINPTEAQLQLFSNNPDTNWPDPIEFTFGRYTIRGLVTVSDKDWQATISDKEWKSAAAHVYKRSFELGYRHIPYHEFNDERFRNFYYGVHNYSNGKTDRLGEKYAWKGFFDHAGVRLAAGVLSRGRRNNHHNIAYKRLSEIELDVSMPVSNKSIAQRIYPGNLLEASGTEVPWFAETKIDTLLPFFRYDIHEQPYIMLRGWVKQKERDTYRTRAYLLAETIFIYKNAHFEKLKSAITKVHTGWDDEDEIDCSPELLGHAYFGELYWADTIPANKKRSILISTGELKSGKRIKLPFKAESALCEYFRNSDSWFDDPDDFNEYYPAAHLGRSLGLQPDPTSGKILDNTQQTCFHTIKFEEENAENKFCYLRADLLEKYMQEHNLALMYRVKQHSFTRSCQRYRFMKFFVR